MEQPSTDFNPGQKLYDYLQTILPRGKIDESESATHFITKSDRILRLSGAFVGLSYDSCVAHLLRRIITGAVWIKRKCDRLNHGQADFIKSLRAFVTEHYEFPPVDVERVCVLLIECVRATEAKVSPGLRRQMLNDTVAKGGRCYICGCVLTLTEGDRARAEVEHVWPKSLGGSSTPNNLRLACFDCNKKKKDYLSTSDYHFERMCCTVVDRFDSSFGGAFAAEFRLAVLARSKYSCSVCGGEPLSIGPLKFARRNKDDAWHLLNVEAVCDAHDPERES